ncbi:unnamed protein product [Vitrella brassicaformis CCMP3155]|uniref:DUF202 domain-containing protein n=2 Tax=Vitrella brassicaformis TaxID=1169539 RepID=A0A0G4GQC9_VITBC|nr:unnamed protein product [Vitrella brassicaformis CCMP3155]|mmetsp:Transcript_38377/g.96122  ORF Transcript_38377/g.96122 Transcript_38377/m.96122 type:complete len:210 (+) Transcript_38377:110-739(+)|eukprot:CEM32662.1 unnamed protein product [Vitrella brassicaformis CCMP3155]
MAVRRTKDALLRYFVEAGAVKNEGSVARDHLANERTFLAWGRTGLAFIAFGLGIQEFYFELLRRRSDLSTQCRAGASPAAAPDEQAALPFQAGAFTPCLSSAICLTTGCGFVTFGAYRYFKTQYLLNRGMFKPGKTGVVVIILFSTAMTMAGGYNLGSMKSVAAASPALPSMPSLLSPSQPREATPSPAAAAAPPRLPQEETKPVKRAA